MDRGSAYRRCGCWDKATGRLLGACCPGLRSREHGSWYFSADLPSATGERHRVRRGGFATRDAAAALEALASPTAGPEPGLSTGDGSSRWLASRVSLRASTSRGYAAHVRSYLVPYLGGIPLAGLTAGDVQAMFTPVIRNEGALGRPVSAATLHRIHATLRAALNGAVRAGLISVNPGRYPELPRAARPRPQVWTPPLTGRWQLEGWRPAVGVWTAAQTSQFLAQVRGHRLYALFHLVALRGPRRGEAAGLRWSDLDLDAGTLTVFGAAAAARRPAGRRASEERRRTPGHRPGHHHHHRAARAQDPAAGRAGRRRDPVGRDRVRVHHRDRDPVPAGPDDPPVGEAGRRLRAAPGGGAVHPCRERTDPQLVHRLHLRPARALPRAPRDPLTYRGHIQLGERRRRLRRKRGQLLVGKRSGHAFRLVDQVSVVVHGTTEGNACSRGVPAGVTIIG